MWHALPWLVWRKRFLSRRRKGRKKAKDYWENTKKTIQSQCGKFSRSRTQKPCDMPFSSGIGDNGFVSWNEGAGKVKNYWGTPKNLQEINAENFTFPYSKTMWHAPKDRYWRFWDWDKWGRWGKCDLWTWEIGHWDVTFPSIIPQNRPRFKTENSSTPYLNSMWHASRVRYWRFWTHGTLALGFVTFEVLGLEPMIGNWFSSKKPSRNQTKNSLISYSNSMWHARHG